MSIAKIFTQFGLPFFASLILSLFITPLVRVYAVKYKLVTFPKQDRWRRRVVASFGGSAIFLAFLITFLIFGAYDLKFLGFIIGSIAIFSLGFIDDIIHIKPDTKLIGQITVACIMIMFGVTFNIFSSPLANIPLTILWIVGIINAFNLLDNMDGLSAGIAAIAALVLCIHSLINGSAQLGVLSVIILGSALGFLRYNFSPAKIFMGDCGSMFLGFVLAAGSLMGAVGERSGLLIAMAIPVLVLAVPIFDTILVTLTRSFNDRPISKGGRDHASHRLVALGLSEKKAVLFLYAISAVCGLGAILYTRVNLLVISLLMGILFIALFIFGMFLGSEVKVYHEEELGTVNGKKKMNGKVVFLNGFIYNKRRIAEVIIDLIIVIISYIAAFLLRYEGVFSEMRIALILESLPIVLIVKMLMFFFFGLYRGVWRYVGLYDLIAIVKATSLGSILSIITIVFLFRFENYSRSIFVIDWLMTFMCISGVRVLFRMYKEFFANVRIAGKRILIFGAGDAGELVLREIRQNRNLGYKAIGFVDDDDKKLNRIIHGVKVLGKGSNLEKLIHKYKIDELLVAIPVSHKRRVADIYSICQKNNIAFTEISKIIPSGI